MVPLRQSLLSVHTCTEATSGRREPLGRMQARSILRQRARGPAPPPRMLPWPSHTHWPMADVVARGGIGSLRAPCGTSGT
eukprot:4886517-Prymnesium_polylepis.1